MGPPDAKQYISATIRNSEGKKRIFFIAFLSTMAICLSIIEHMVPKPLPWMRIGLANAITLYAFTIMRPKEVLLVVFSRVLATSLLIGSFLSVTFLLSISGAVASFAIMWVLYSFFHRYFSLVGISVAGAATSNAVQLLVVNTLFVNSRLSFYFLPLILLFALLGGVISGFFGKFLCENI
jgi:heptaprenyl diphosphate synthase